MLPLVQKLRRRLLETLFVGCVACFSFAAYGLLQPPPERGVVASLRNSNFPDTYIDRIDVDLTSPHHYVRLRWAGQLKNEQETGPFRSSPGAGCGDNGCGDPIESNCEGSNCTPIGTRKVEGHREHLESDPSCRYVTLIDGRRAIGFHSHDIVPSWPSSQGCVRLAPEPARLIYDNSIVGKTEIVIAGTWTNPDRNGR